MTRHGLERSYLQTALFDLQSPSRHGFNLRGAFKHSWHCIEDQCALNTLFFSLSLPFNIEESDCLVSGSWWAFKIFILAVEALTEFTGKSLSQACRGACLA